MKNIFCLLLMLISACGSETVPYESRAEETIIEKINVSGIYEGVLSLEFADCGSYTNNFPRSAEIFWDVVHDTDTNDITLSTNDVSYGVAVQDTFSADDQEFTEDHLTVE